MLGPVDRETEPSLLESRQFWEHLIGKLQSVILLERRSRVLDRVERGEEIPHLLICVHQCKRGDPGFGGSFVEPVPYVAGLERVIPTKLLRLGDHMFERDGSVVAGLHRSPDLGILVGEPL